MAPPWRFFRAGGFDQVKLTRGADLVALESLDQKLWVALACPVSGLEFDRRTLELIDTDKDGRVRANELIAATRWIGKVLEDLSLLDHGSNAVPLDAISSKTPEGQLLRKTAETVLAGLGRSDTRVLTVDDARDAAKALAGRALNGDGILPPDAADDPAVRRAIEDMLATATVPAADRSGKPGVDSAMVGAFFDALAAWLAWWEAGAAEGVRPLGIDTPGAHDAWTAVRGKVDDYFVRCQVAAFDPRSADLLNGEAAAYTALGAQTWSADAALIAHLPLARVAAGAALPLADGVNPAWSAAIATFRQKVVSPLVGDRTTLDEPQWRALCARFAAYEAWRANRVGGSVEKLGEARIRELVASDVRAKIEALLEQDRDVAPLVEAVESLERLVRYVRDLLRLANNFVAFRDFYAREAPAVFQVGTLYLDQRSCDLCIRVSDPAKHATMAPLSGLCLVYCDLTDATGAKMSIVAAMTNGDVDNIMVGRNGLFYDRSGKDWDATVTKLVANPISLRQAFWAPYKRAYRMAEDLVNQRIAAMDASADAKLSGAVAATDAATAGAAPAEPPKPIDVGTVAAIGVAVGGLTAALGAILQSFFGLGVWMPLGVVGLVLLISGPSMVLAWLKLRQRNLGPLLDASGWAVNAQAKLNLPLGSALTRVATLPADAEIDTSDKFAERRRPWALYGFLLVVVLLAGGWYLGKLDPYLPGPAKSVEVLGSLAPSAAPATPEAAPPEPPAAPAPPAPAAP